MPIEPGADRQFMTSVARLGVLGGTFDPIHVGHVAAAAAARRALALDRILLMPTHVPPHRAVQPQASPFHRFTMTALAAEADPAFAASDLNCRRPARPIPSTTLARLAGSGVFSPADLFHHRRRRVCRDRNWRDYPTARPRAFRGDLETRPCCRGASIRIACAGLENDRRGNGSPHPCRRFCSWTLPRPTCPRPPFAGVRARALALTASCLRRSPRTSIVTASIPAGQLHEKAERRPRLPQRRFRRDRCCSGQEGLRARRPGSATLVGVPDHFLLCTGQNQRQVKAIADVEEALKRAKLRPAHVEGYDRAEWVLLDYFTFIVHIFTPTTGVLRPRTPLGPGVRIVVDEPEGEATGKASGPAAGRRAPRRVLTALPRRPTASSPFFWLRDAPHAIDRSSALPAGRSAHPVGRRFFQSRRRSATSVVIRCQPGAKPASSRHAARVAGAGASRSIEGAPLGYDGALRQILHAFKYEGRRTIAAPRCAPHGAGGPAAPRDSGCRRTPCRCIAGGNDRAGSTRRETSPFKSAPRSPTS